MDRLASRSFLLYLLFLVFTGTKGQRCVSGWFGESCQHQCHCLNDAVCDETTGKCPGGCDVRWFGPQCQYRDAAYNNRSKLTDGFVSTCLSGEYAVEYFPMADNIVFTWMRLITNKPGMLDCVSITFLKNKLTPVYSIDSLKRLYISDTVLEVYGELAARFDTIKLSFASPETSQSFCSMQVSAVKDVACPTGKWGRDCEKDCKCRDHYESCFISTGRCPSSSKPQFQEGVVCPQGIWERDSDKECKCPDPSESCLDSTEMCPSCCKPRVELVADKEVDILLVISILAPVLIGTQVVVTLICALGIWRKAKSQQPVGGQVLSFGTMNVQGLPQAQRVYPALANPPPYEQCAVNPCQENQPSNGQNAVIPGQENEPSNGQDAFIPGQENEPSNGQDAFIPGQENQTSNRKDVAFDRHDN